MQLPALGLFRVEALGQPGGRQRPWVASLLFACLGDFLPGWGECAPTDPALQAVSLH